MTQTAPNPQNPCARRSIHRLAAAALLSASFLITPAVLGVELAKWDFTGAPGNQTAQPASANAPGITASPVTRGSGIAATAAGGSISANEWTTANEVDSDDYFEFGIGIDAATTTTLASISFAERRSGTGIRNFVLRSSLDGFSSDTVTARSVPDDTDTRDQTLLLPPVFSNLNDATITFRLYGYSAEGSGGTWRLANHSTLGGLVIDSGVVAPDTTPPVVVTYAPASGASNVAVDTNLVLTFNEPVTALAGNLTIDDGVNPAIPIPVDSPQVSVAGNVVTINPLADLAVGTTYRVLIDANTFQDAAENKFIGISNPATWTFSTIGPDIAGPVVVSVFPANGASNVDPAVTPVINYDENLLVGTGNILIKNADTSAVVATFSVTDDSQVLVFNNQVFLTLPAPLPTDTGFYVEIPAGAFTDALANPSPAYGGSGVWGFTTPIIPALTAEGPYTQDFAAFSVGNPSPPAGWTLTGPVTAFPTDLAQQAWGTGITGGLREAANLLGFQATTTANSLTATLQLVNDTGAEITSLVVGYTGKVERPTEGRTPAWTVTVAGQPVPALTYSTGDGDNFVKIASVAELSIPQGAVFTLSWATDRGLTTGASRQIGLTNVSIAPGSATFPPSIAAVALNFNALTQDSAEFASEVTTDGGSPITARGFVISPALENPSPEIGGEGVSTLVDEGAEVGPFGFGVLGLAPSTQYAVRAYATNVEGTRYSATVNLFTLATPPALVDSYSQAFNGFDGTILNGTLPAGWKVVSSGGINGFAGTWGPTTSSGGLIGNVSNPGVLGYQHVGTSGIVTVSLTLTNNTGGALEQLYVSYLGRVERANQSRTPEWTVSLNGTAVDELTYSTASGADEQKGHLITGLSIAEGATFTLSWSSDADLPVGGGTRRQIGIANVLVSTDAPVGLSYLEWAIANVGGAGPLVDSDLDGVPNGVEYFMGETGSSFTPNPQPDANGVITWPRDPNATEASFKVRSSVDLQVWSDILAPDPNLTISATSVSYRLPTTPGPFFIRLEVTVPEND